MDEMKIVNSLDNPEVVDCLQRGGVVVARTDTLYGVLARADDEQAVTRVYQLKDRSEHKSPIVLISDVAQLYDAPDQQLRELCADKWPGPVSIIIPSKDAPKWLRRENDSIAYRLPARAELCALPAQTGPLIAPSANPEGESPAMNVEQAVAYFGDAVDVYVDGGQVESAEPSQLLRVDESGNVERLR
jgi:L-threonylcarbamoyladenylate synthase